MKETQRLINKAEEAIQDLESSIQADFERIEGEKEELEELLSEAIKPETLAEEMKLKILKRMHKQLSLNEIEYLELVVAKNKEHFPHYNPHI